MRLSLFNGTVPSPKPLTKILKSSDSNNLISNSFHKSRAIPKQSYPGPKFAVVAGAFTFTLFITGAYYKHSIQELLLTSHNLACRKS
ncbi:MAG: Uncharacterised protein [Chloroflexota bacterium]|nr:MAG: Uncharacterised protein [Chloroflexota bacterium]